MNINNMNDIDYKSLHTRIKKNRGYVQMINDRLKENGLRTYGKSYIVQVVKGYRANLDVIDAAVWVIEKNHEKKQQVMHKVKHVLSATA
jgi:hypothetical protein